jgi:hypothetical protein
MKIAFLILFLVLPVAALGQNPQGMNEQDMQQMMQQMQKMQSCMQSVDQAKLKELEQRSSQVEAEVKSLCADGRRAEAQQRAVAFGMTMAQDPALQKIRQCSKMLQGVIPKMPFLDQNQATSNQHVCDQ